MAVLTIPLQDASDLGKFVFTVDLDGVSFQLNFTYNSREDFWYFDVLDVEGNHLRSGLKAVANFPLFRTWSEQVRPAGELLVIDTTESPTDPGLDAFGIDAVLSYIQEVTVLEAIA